TFGSGACVAASCTVPVMTPLPWASALEQSRPSAQPDARAFARLRRLPPSLRSIASSVGPRVSESGYGCPAGPRKCQLPLTRTMGMELQFSDINPRPLRSALIPRFGRAGISAPRRYRAPGLLIERLSRQPCDAEEFSRPRLFLELGEPHATFRATRPE